MPGILPDNDNDNDNNNQDSSNKTTATKRKMLDSERVFGQEMVMLAIHLAWSRCAGGRRNRKAQ